MRKYTIEDVKKGSMFVPIESVQLNNWNPKQKKSEEYYKVRQSIEVNGQVMPVITRNKGSKYEILDGEQRFTAMQELNYTKVWIVNLGDVPDSEAKSTTIWMEQAVPFDDNLLAELLVELKGEVELPYTEDEIELITGVFPAPAEEDEEEDNSELTRYSLTVYKSDKDDVKANHQAVLDKYLDVPAGIDAETVNWAIVKLATMQETQALLAELIKTKLKANMEEINESNNTESN